jgi:hypothetical protein
MNAKKLRAQFIRLLSYIKRPTISREEAEIALRLSGMDSMYNRRLVRRALQDKQVA